MKTRSTRGVAIAGLGAIGTRVARALLAGIDGLHLVAVARRDPVLPDWLAAQGILAVPIEAAAEHGEIVVECLPRAAFDRVADPAVRRGRTLLVLSSGALLPRMDLFETARSTGARIVTASGAIGALDTLAAMREQELTSVTLVTRKPPNSFEGNAWLAARGIEPTAVTEPTCVFRGNAFEAARAFPANINVGATAALRGIGPERTQVEIWADPGVTRNIHRLRAESETARMSFEVEALPDPANPKSSVLAALSAIAELRRLGGE